jgi:hypothetical protein
MMAQFHTLIHDTHHRMPRSERVMLHAVILILVLTAALVAVTS